jgi:type IV pilus assembly protein PilQ
MKKQGQNFFFKVFAGVFFVLISGAVCLSQDQVSALQVSQPVNSDPSAEGAQAAPVPHRDINTMDNVTLDFKDADIRNILKIISQKSGVNIVATADVVGTVTIKLVEVPWDRAMDIILKSNGYGFQRQGNVILVTKIENMSKIQSEEPLKTEIINLKFLDAQDAQRIIIPMLSARGKISILYMRGQRGWQFGSFQIGEQGTSSKALVREDAAAAKKVVVSIEKTPLGETRSSLIDDEPNIKSKTIIVTDTDAVLDRIMNDILPQIDKKPKQVLVEAKIMEVNVDKLRDFGVDYGTGQNGATSKALSYVTSDRNSQDRSALSQTAGHLLSSLVKPSNYGPKAAVSGIEPFDAGLQLVFKKLTGTELEIVVHALEENIHANTLSAPRIMTLDNQEASMLVGYHTPILKSTVTAGTSGGDATVTQDLGYYQEIGIRLNVVPQVSENGYINMIIHPSITSSSSTVDATSTAGNQTTVTSYPVIDTREVQTQILMKDGETVVIGGLLKDLQTKGVIGVPFLSSIPIIGALFRRETTDNSKIDLLIFITARIVKDDEFSEEELAKIEKRIQGIAEKPSKKEKTIKK